MKLELTDSEWMDLIDGERPGGLTACCANISEVRDQFISAARAGGEVHRFQIDRFRLILGAALAGHDLDGIPALDKVRAQLGAAGHLPHDPAEFAELFRGHGPDAPAGLTCALCMFVKVETGEDRDDRMTIINGQAVCGEHAGYVQGGGFSSAYSLAVTQRDADQ
jgi:hypothetical protein